MIEEENLDELLEKDEDTASGAVVAIITGEVSYDAVEIPDNNHLKLIVLEPGTEEKELEEWIKKKNGNFRIYKNTMIFSMADNVGMGDLKDNIREFLALKEIQEEVDSGEYESLGKKKGEIKDRLNDLKGEFSYLCRKAYNTLYVKDDRINLGMPTAGKESLSSWYRRELESNEEILTNMHYRVLIKEFMDGKDKVSSHKILEQFYKDRNLSMLSSDEVLKRAIKEGVENGHLGIAVFEDDSIVRDSFAFYTPITTANISFVEDEYLLTRSYCEPISCPECRSLVEDDRCPKCDIKVEPPEEEKEPEVSEPERETHEKRYRRVKMRIKDVKSTKIVDLNTGVFLPLGREVGQFDIEIYFDIKHEDGIPKKTINDTVKETLRQIQAKIEEEELEDEDDG